VIDGGEWLDEMGSGAMSGALRRFGAPLLALALMASASEPALAQTSDASPAEDSSGDNIAKGVVGGAMLGAEVVMLGESALRLRPAWLYLVGGGAGALGGGYLGYRISRHSSNKPPAFLLAGGIALIIPTIMGVLTATEYAPADSRRLEPQNDDDSQGDSEARGPMRLELPNVGLAQTFSREQLARFRVHQVTELHLELLCGAF
jgi:hypothetical protein